MPMKHCKQFDLGLFIKKDSVIIGEYNGALLQT